MGIQLKQALLVLITVAAVVALGAQIFRFTRQQTASTDFPGDRMHFVCVDCLHGFDSTRKKFSAWADENDHPLPCPECGKQRTEVAQKCPLPDCGAYHSTPNVVIDGKVCCPVCQNPLP